jgi:hypothetical protein
LQSHQVLRYGKRLNAITASGVCGRGVSAKETAGIASESCRQPAVLRDIRALFTESNSIGFGKNNTIKLIATITLRR